MSVKVILIAVVPAVLVYAIAYFTRSRAAAFLAAGIAAFVGASFGNPAYIVLDVGAVIAALVLSFSTDVFEPRQGAVSGVSAIRSKAVASLFKKLLAFASLGLLAVAGLGLFAHAHECRTQQDELRRLSEQLGSVEYTAIRAAKQACKAHVEAALTERRIAYAQVRVMHQGVTQLHRDVRVGVFGTSGGQFSPAELSLACHTDHSGRRVLEVRQSASSYPMISDSDEVVANESHSRSLALTVSECSWNPLFRRN